MTHYVNSWTLRTFERFNKTKFKFRYILLLIVFGSFTSLFILDYFSKLACLDELRMEARPYSSEFKLLMPFHLTQTITCPGQYQIREFIVFGKSRWLVGEALVISDPVIP